MHSCGSSSTSNCERLLAISGPDAGVQRLPKSSSLSALIRSPAAIARSNSPIGLFPVEGVVGAWARAGSGGASVPGRRSRSPEDGSSHTAIQEGLDARDATFATPDLTTYCRLDELGLVVVGQLVEPDRVVLACRVVDADEADRWCRRCGCEGSPRDTVMRRLAHEPVGWRPTTLLITIRRYRCTGCGHVWRQDTSRAAEPRAKLSRSALRWLWWPWSAST